MTKLCRYLIKAFYLSRAAEETLRRWRHMLNYINIPSCFYRSDSFTLSAILVRIIRP